MEPVFHDVFMLVLPLEPLISQGNQAFGRKADGRAMVFRRGRIQSVDLRRFLRMNGFFLKLRHDFGEGVY